MTARRRFILTAAALALGAARDASSQVKVYRIGFLAPDSPSDPAPNPFLDALMEGLRERGYQVGKNLQLDIRYARGQYERLPGLAKELAESRPDLLMSVGTPATVALKNATSTIPIVMVSSGDALGTGLVANLASSGNNITGATFFGRELMLKRLQLLRDTLPGMQRVAVLVNTANQTTEPNLHAMRESTRPLKLELVPFDVRGTNDIAPAFEGIRKAKVQALAAFEEAAIYNNARMIADLALRQRLPSAAFTEFADQGGLLGYGVNFFAIFRRAGYFVDKIVKGEAPSKIPIERPTTFDFVVNLKTARALSLRMPQSVLGSATRVIE